MVWRDPRTPKFVGDIPHTWVGSDFVRSFLDLFAYEREEDASLVVAAGLPEAWVRSARGVSVKGLGTPWGPLDLALTAEGKGIRVRLSGLKSLPAGGLAVRPPLSSGPADGDRQRAPGASLPGRRGRRPLPSRGRRRPAVTTSASVFTLLRRIR